MSHLQVACWDDLQLAGSGLVDALLHNGVDGLAARRTHLRQLTMARQAAERQYAHSVGREGPSQPDETHACAAQYRVELARIEGEHIAWLHAQGVDVRALPARRTKLPRH
jgi:hypothetical protein